MKKLNLFLGLGAIALSLFFTSCEEEVNPKPVITYDQTSPLALAAGETSAVLTGTIVAEASLSKIELYKATGLSEELLETITSFSSGDITTTDDVNYNFRFTIAVTEDVTIKITATDKDDQIVSKSIEITAAAGTPLVSQGTVQLGAGGSALPSYYSVSTGQTYNFAAAQTNANVIDIIFTSTASEAKFTAPKNAANATISGSGRTTLYAKVALSFDEMTSADVDGVSLSAEEVTVQLGDVVVFETEDDTRGAFVIDQLEVATNGDVTINIKVKQ